MGRARDRQPGAAAADSPRNVSETVLLVQVNDLHVNSTVALCPAKVRRDDGGWYYASREQGWLRECWQDFWQQVEERKQRLGCPVCTAIVGDAVDRNVHSKVQLVEYESGVIMIAMAEEVMEEPRIVSDYLFVVRGTEAHVGGQGYLEEQLAQRIHAVPDEVRGTSSWWHWVASLAQVKVDLAHHPQTSARRPWTRDSAAARQAAITWSEYHEINESPPQVVGRAHVHYWAKGYKDDTFAFFGPPWQLTTAFGYRLGTSRKVEPVGGVLIECRDGSIAWDVIRYAAPKGQIWTIPAQLPKMT